MSKALQINRNELEGTAAELGKHGQDICVADMSGSMREPAIEGKSRFECLKIALETHAARLQLLAFNNRVWECSPADLDNPSGGTALHSALQHARALEPIHVLVICDGEPNNPQAAIDEAALIAANCVIDALYIGPMDDAHEQGRHFMSDLAEVGRGRYIEFDMRGATQLQLTQRVGALLALPGPGVIEL